jgi:hypothetical protein
MSMTHSHFDRLASLHRNRKARNACLIAAAFSLLLGVVVGLDAVITGGAVKLGYVFVLGVVFIVSSSFAAYYHLRFISRE